MIGTTGSKWAHEGKAPTSEGRVYRQVSFNAEVQRPAERGRAIPKAWPGNGSFEVERRVCNIVGHATSDPGVNRTR